MKRVNRYECQCREFDVQNQLRPLPKAFNKKKFVLSYNVVNNPILSEIQNLSKKQCLGKNPWPEIQKSIHG